MSRVTNEVVVVTGTMSHNEDNEPQYEYSFTSYALAQAFVQEAEQITSGDVDWRIESYSAEIKGSIKEEVADLKKEWAEFTGESDEGDSDE